MPLEREIYLQSYVKFEVFDANGLLSFSFGDSIDFSNTEIFTVKILEKYPTEILKTAAGRAYSFGLLEPQGFEMAIQLREDNTVRKLNTLMFQTNKGRRIRTTLVKGAYDLSAGPTGLDMVFSYSALEFNSPFGLENVRGQGYSKDLNYTLKVWESIGLSLPESGAAGGTPPESPTIPEEPEETPGF